MFSASYANSLRTLGQALEVLQVKDIDIQSGDDNFIVRGKIASDAPVTTLPPGNQEDRLRLVWGGRARRQGEDVASRAQPSSVLLELRYKPEDLGRLERENQMKRRSPGAMPDSHSVSQVLRSVGGYVESRGARLVSVCWTERALIVHYEFSDRRREVEALAVSTLYDHWVRMYMRRATRH